VWRVCARACLCAHYVYTVRAVRVSVRCVSCVRVFVRGVPQGRRTTATGGRAGCIFELDVE